ncbi:MAG: YihY/virulence factor BrkB family protein [Mariniblastus sp.]|nr:YihY/virulence factor BrkB family protein [Mariniblastus sp.]
MFRFWRLFKGSFQIWLAAHASRMSAALAYFTMLSMAPLVLIAIAIAGYVFDDQLAEEQIIKQVEIFTSSQEIANTVAGLIHNAQRPATGIVASTISLIILFWASSAVFTQLQFTLNQIWKVKPRHKFLNTLRMRLFGISMVFGVGLSLLASLVLKTMLTTVNGYMGEKSDSVSWLHLADRGVMYLLVPFVLSLLFWLVPMTKIRWTDVVPAALLTSVLVNISRNAIEVYLKFSTTSEVYGAAGSLVVMLIWVYINGLVLFYGAAFSRSWAETFGSRRHQVNEELPGEESDRAAQPGEASESAANAPMESSEDAANFE